MTSAESIDPPKTIAGWERVLVDRFLRIGPEGDASPIRSFGITPATLAEACQVECETQAEAAFKTAILADRFLWSALSTGSRRPANLTSPNCFVYLAMSLLIDSLLDSNYSRMGQYRERMAKWLDTSRSLMQLKGIAEMWRSLAKWLEDRVNAGEPFRRLILPDPQKWTQIGYTRRLSFPSRSDIRFLKQIMAGIPEGTSEPPNLIRSIDAAIKHSVVSSGLEEAFQEFQRAFRQGRAYTDHRFWRLLLLIQPDDHTKLPEARLELEFDEDSRRFFRLLASGETESTTFRDLGCAIHSAVISKSSNLATVVKHGIVFFRRVGTARWQAQSNPPLPSGLIHVALSSVQGSKAQGAIVDLDSCGDWLITRSPISHRTLDDILSRLQLKRLRNQVLEIKFDGGIRVGSGWLGRRCFLPQLEVGDRCISVCRLPSQSEGICISVREGVLTSRATVEGNYALSVSSEPDGAPDWSRHLKFIADATPHPALNGAFYSEEPVSEWLALEASSGRAKPDDHRALAWEEVSEPAADLFEALYAAGRSGFSEAEIVDLIARGSDSTAEKWAILRSLHESGFVDARYRRQWRGRNWTLGRLRLSNIGTNKDSLIIVEGAFCAALEQEFQEVVMNLGGRPFRRLGTSPWSPAVIGAVEADTETLAKRLGWPVSVQNLEPQLRPVMLELSNLVAEHHILVSSWDWLLRKFVVRAEAEPFNVSLTRWEHPGGCVHDVYRVESKGQIWAHNTRNAAILHAHIVAKIPIFSVDDDTLICTAKEGALPLEIARWLRKAALAGGGMTDRGYSYPLGGIDPALVACGLPNCIEGAGELIAEATTAALLMAARRSAGRLRVCWLNGRIIVNK